MSGELLILASNSDSITSCVYATKNTHTHTNQPNGYVYWNTCLLKLVMFIVLYIYNMDNIVAVGGPQKHCKCRVNGAR